MSKRTLLSLTVLLLACIVSLATLVRATLAVSALGADRTDNDLLLVQVCGIPGVPACTATPPPPGDSDGDGVPDDADGCPSVPGPASNSGCPEPTPAPPTENDRDGDGTPNDVDRCPDEGGHADNGGCPFEDGAAPTAIPTVIPILLPALPTTGDCILATQSAEGVNIRGEPSLDGAIVGALDPTLLYPVIANLETVEGVWHRIADGWVASWVVRTGGECALLPYVEQLGGPDANPGPPNAPFEFELVGIDSGPIQVGTRFCQNNLHVQGQASVDPTNPNSNAIIIDFNIGASEEAAATDLKPTEVVLKHEEMDLGASVVQSVLAQGSTFTEWCIEGFADGHSFVIDWQAPPDPDTQGFVVNWSAGFSSEADEVVVIAIIQPAPDEAGEQSGQTLVWTSPLDPDAQGLVINWNIGAADPPDPSAPQGIIIDWSVGEGSPPEGDAPNGEPVPDDNMPQGIIIDYMPGAAIPPDPQAPQGIIIEWFPNGVDPEAQGIIIDYMPGGSLEFAIP